MILGDLKLGPYLRRDADQVYVPANGRCNLAVEERDLLAEAASPLRFRAAADVIVACYPTDLALVG